MGCYLQKLFKTHSVIQEATSDHCMYCVRASSIKPRFSSSSTTNSGILTTRQIYDMTESTEAEYKKLPLTELGLATVSFDMFCYLREKDIDKLCDKEELTFEQIVEIRRTWIQHPERRRQTSQQGKVNSCFDVYHIRKLNTAPTAGSSPYQNVYAGKKRKAESTLHKGIVDDDDRFLSLTIANLRRHTTIVGEKIIQL
jgi:hypothetical protein